MTTSISGKVTGVHSLTANHASNASIRVTMVTVFVNHISLVVPIERLQEMFAALRSGDIVTIIDDGYVTPSQMSRDEPRRTQMNISQ